MVDIRAAFDASKESPSGTTTIAGYIADASRWQSVQTRWNGQLVLAGLKDFHLSEIRNRFPNGRWLDVVRPFAQVVRDAELRSITASLKDSDWSCLDHDSEYRKVCPQREHACLDMLFGVLADDVRLEFNNEPITVVFDNDYGNSKSAFRVYDAWRKRTGHPGFNILMKGGVPWDAVPLQCADMVAGLLRLNPFSRAMLNDTLKGLDDNDPLAEVANIALSHGRGAMWSAPLAERVEAMLQRRDQ